MTVFKNDIGVEIILEVGADLSTATLLQIAYKKPSGVSGLWTGALRSTSQIVFTSTTGTLDETGRWKVQAKATFPLKLIHGQETTLTVEDILA